MQSLLSSKRGVSVSSVIAPLARIMMLSVFLMALYLVYDKFLSTISITQIFLDHPTSISNASKFTAVMNLFDYIVVVMTLSLIAGIGYTSYRIAADKVFFAIVLFTSILYGYIGYVLSYTGSTIVLSGVFSSILVYFPKTLIIITNLHWLALVQLVIGSIALYAKKRRGQYVRDLE